jgi:hypothetical protein
MSDTICDIRNMLSRRTLLTNSFKVSTGLMLTSTLKRMAAAPAAESALVDAVQLPPNFIGLGYEMSSIATPGLLSAANERYVRLVKALGSKGVIRVGGIVADYTRYADTAAAKAEPKETMINAKLIEEFGEFLRAIGWTAIWSLNFAQGSIAEAVTEAQAVSTVLGPRLLAFELGNEVENYDRGDKPFRRAPYTYEKYRSEYSFWRSKILQAVPGARFAAPDTAASVEWVENMALDAKDDVQLLTTHYYRGGQKQGSAEQLLNADSRLRDVTKRLRTASQKSGIPWRMCETNSFFGGGRPGVSDTFTGALWLLDFMLFLASSGCAGVNIETGVNQLGFVSSYSPIRQDESGRARVGAPYYGMLAFATAADKCAGIASAAVPGLTGNVSAYQLGANGKTRSAVLINRESADQSISINQLGLHHVEMMRLVAPNIHSVDGVTFAGGRVREDGSWVKKQMDRIAGGHVVIPGMSAVVLKS